MGLSPLVAVIAAAVACGQSELAGAWMVQDTAYPDGPRFACGIGIDAEGRIEWATCERRIFPRARFGVDGSFTVTQVSGRIVGTVNDGSDDYHVLASMICGRQPLITGEVRPAFAPDNPTPFTGRRMSGAEVDRLADENRSWISEKRQRGLPRPDADRRMRPRRRRW
jgi:hypothetical protein